MFEAFEWAKDKYAALGVDAEAAMERLSNTPISLHCWQGDDVGGFESEDGLTGGGIQATGNYPGKARNADELRQDLDTAYSLLPGKHRLNLHAIYAETGGVRLDRTEIGPEHFARWIDWAADQKIGMDFNQSFFSHPRANDGFTLSSRDESNRQFWVEHGKICRRIGAEIGRKLGSPCVTNRTASRRLSLRSPAPVPGFNSDNFCATTAGGAKPDTISARPAQVTSAARSSGFSEASTSRAAFCALGHRLPRLSTACRLAD